MLQRRLGLTRNIVVTPAPFQSTHSWAHGLLPIIILISSLVELFGIVTPVRVEGTGLSNDISLSCGYSIRIQCLH
jgi:hypothetical protein